MTRRITLLLATCMLLGLLGLVPLLAGFVPQYWGAEMRGLINPQVISLRHDGAGGGWSRLGRAAAGGQDARHFVGNAAAAPADGCGPF